MNKIFFKKGDISMETVVKVIIGLAVLLVVLGIFTMQSRKGSKGLDDVSTASQDSAESAMCIGDGFKCNATCAGSATIEETKKCFLPGTVCCKIN